MRGIAVARSCCFRRYKLFMLKDSSLISNPPRVLVLVSGDGSNMRMIAQALDEIGQPLTAVLSNRPDSKGLAWAKEQGISTQVIDHKAYETRDLFDDALLVAVMAYDPDWLFLAGFMRVLRADFVEHFKGRLVNIHPSLLPAFTGLNTHQRALDAGVRFHGATVHWVTKELDAGKPIAQGALEVRPSDTKETLERRVKAIEHQIYPQAVLGLISQSQGHREQQPVLPAWRLYDGY
jgi:phosphoribosylglycinamide formyltransferase 1